MTAPRLAGLFVASEYVEKRERFETQPFQRQRILWPVPTEFEVLPSQRKTPWKREQLRWTFLLLLLFTGKPQSLRLSFSSAHPSPGSAPHSSGRLRSIHSSTLLNTILPALIPQALRARPTFVNDFPMLFHQQASCSGCLSRAYLVPLPL